MGVIRLDALYTMDVPYCSFPHVRHPKPSSMYFQYPTFNARWIRLGAPIRESERERGSESERDGNDYTESRLRRQQNGFEPSLPPSFLHRRRSRRIRD